MPNTQYLLSLPPNIVMHFAELEGRPLPQWVCSSDPAGSKLGSGGGTAHLLLEAWRQTGMGQSFSCWLRDSRKLMIHGGGQSRRLPAYAPAGKLLAPMPIWRWATGQRLNQTLLDLQLPYFQEILDNAPASTVAMVTSGDVLLRFPELPELPDADIVCLGLWTRPEEAQHFGVFFTSRQQPETLEFFLQKPEPETIRKLASSHLFLVDTGVWLFSERAIQVLLKKCRCQPKTNRCPSFYELYAEFGLGLGRKPTQTDPDIATLTSAVVALSQGEFYHFGTSRDLIRSSSMLQNLVLDQRGQTPNAKPHPDIYQQNSLRDCTLSPKNRNLWIENSRIPATWTLTHDHVLTGIPANDWALALPPGTCLDAVPVLGAPEEGTRHKALGTRGMAALKTPGNGFEGNSLEGTRHKALGTSECENPESSIQNPEVESKNKSDFVALGAPGVLAARLLRSGGEKRPGTSGTPPKKAKSQATVIRRQNHFTSDPQKTADNQQPTSLVPSALCLVPCLQSVCLRPYGIDDPFRGEIGKAATLWLGRPAGEWFKARGITFAAAGIDPETDIQAASIFPVILLDQVPAGFVQWLIDAKPSKNPAFRMLWLGSERLSADGLGIRADLQRLYAQRTDLRQATLPALMRNQARSVFYKLDLQQTAKEFAISQACLPPPLPESEPDTLKRVHDLMFHAAVLRQRGRSSWRQTENQAFQLLRDAIVESITTQPAQPCLRLQEDQIAWGRSPVRLDLAGGWTDTPPYCLLNGGRVINLAVDLNGQPPLQVFLKRRETPEIVLRSIDLGVEERITTYAHIADFTKVGGPFSIVKAALALAGFHPRFQGKMKATTLRQQLQQLGGGLELSLVAAVPKGSGLGTSSILAATILGTLNDACGLGWSNQLLITRTLALEQMLTTGGGWQDQVGGTLRGVKFIESAPGLQQAPVVRWLPDQPFGPLYANQTILLYYTGITRVAKNILREIVHGMFLNSASHLNVLREIGAHAHHTCDVVQRADSAAIARAIAQSWQLNQRLDVGTNPPAVQAILSRIQDWTDGAKLLGAGGGGYLLMFAKDATAAIRIREELTQRPPNLKARFVDFSLSQTGLQITKS